MTHLLALATLLITGGLAAALADVARPAPAEGEDDIRLVHYTIDGGGGVSTSATFRLTGTIGQPDAGEHSGDGFLLRGGFWPGVGIITSDVPCPEDFDDDGNVGFEDLVRLLARWGACPDCPEDLNADGMVGFEDIVILLAAWGPCD